MKLFHVSDSDRKRIQYKELQILKEINRICRNHQISYSVAYGSMIGTVRHHGFIPWDDDVDILMLRKDYMRFKEICKIELRKDFFYQSNETDPQYFYLFDKIRLNGTVFKESFVAEYNIHHGIYIDIFPIDYLPNNKWKQKLQYVEFHFFRLGVQSKYLILNARTGKKKWGAALLRLVYAPFSLIWLYKKAHDVAMAYNLKGSHKQLASFFSPYKKKDIFPFELFSEYIESDFEGEKIMIIKEYDKVLKQLYGDYMNLPPKEARVSHHNITELYLGKNI